MSDFYTLLTTVGANAFANANAATLNLSTISVGDDTSAPSISQTSMQSVKWSGPIVDYVKDSNVPGRFTVSCIIPSDQGGFAVNQAGLFDSNGNLLVIAKLSGTYKPVAAQGEVKELRINLVVNATNLDAVTVNIDPNVVVATRAYVGAAVTALENRLGDHITDTGNPHAVTKTQVGLGDVENYPTATQAEAEDGSGNNRFMTPLRVTQAIAKLIGMAFGQHVNDTNNPHGVTKAQVGLGNVENFTVADQAAAEAGTSNSLFMTPMRVAQAIAKLSTGTISSHTSDTNNPHQVTKAQVGLGNVDNLSTANQTEAEAGTASDRFMTPLRVAQAIAALVGNALGSHTSNTANPHQVTKAQVGLGNVENYATATQAEAEAGTASDRFMTPVLVKQAIAANASQGSSISTYRFMAVGTVYVPTSASEFRVIVDHSVDLSGGNCIVSEQAGSTIVTPYGSDQLIRLTSKGSEYIFSKVNSVWRIS